MSPGAMEPPKSGEGCPNNDLKLVAHPRAKSKVWKYFGFDTDAEGCILQWKKIYCRICMAQIAYSGNTSNLSYHLEKNHPEEFCEFVKSNTEQMREAFATAFSKLKPDAVGIPAAAASGCVSSGPQSSTASPLPGASTSSPYSGANCISISSCSPSSNAAPSKAGVDSRRHQELTAAVLRLVCEGLYPPSIVDEPTFRALLRTAEPCYNLPSREYFSGTALLEKYATVRSQVVRELADTPWCGLSVDLWNSTSQNRSYVTVSAHFLGAGCVSDAASPLVSLIPGCRCLKTFEIPEDNIAETVARVFYEAFVEWGIGSKVFGVTTDGSKDLLKACRLLDVAVHMPCLGHAFHAGMREALRVPQLAALLSRCSRLVDYFQRSSVAAYLLYEKQKQRRQVPRMLSSARSTGWLGSFAMLRSLRENQFAVAAVLMEDSNSHHLMLDAAEWNTVDALVDLLQPFVQVVQALSTSCYPAISTVKPVLHMLATTTLRVKDTDAKELGLAKDILSKELCRTYQESPEIDMFLNVAAFLDPRYKRLPFLSAFERQQVENRVVDEAKEVLTRLRDASLDPSPERPDGERAEDAATSPPAKKRALDGHASVMHDMLAEIFCPTGGVEDHEECHAQVLEELSNYKSQKVLALVEDPLKWWRDRVALFPLLPTVLQKYWCVSATRVEPRRLFGSSNTVLGAKRNRLAPAHVHRQVFLYENTRDGGSEPEDEDEGEWGLEPEQVLGLGDPAGLGGFANTRDAAFHPQPGRVAIVTGGTDGIGYATAMQLARLGMHVVIAGNNEGRAQDALSNIKAKTHNGKVEFLYCDLESMASIRDFVREFKAKELPLHVLVNNAGIMMVPQGTTRDGFEKHFGLNYLGHFLLTNLLLDLLVASGTEGQCSRVVTVSSATHYVAHLDLDDLQGSRGYSSHGAYAQSKLALVLFTYRLQALLEARGRPVTANAVDPGVVDTELYRHVFWARGPLHRLVAPWLFKTPEEGAWTSVFAAVSPTLEGRGGRYLYNERDTRSLAVTYDTRLQRELWDASCGLTGLRDAAEDLD